MGLKTLLKSFLGGDKEIVVGLEEIKEILFHRGNKLLLDQVIFWPDGRVIGKLKVRLEICEGHEPIPGQLVMRGVDLIEMAFQLLGIMLAKDDELTDLTGKVFAAREAGSLKVRSGFILVGDDLTLETRTDVDVEDMGHGLIRVASSRMTATVGGKARGTVDSVTLAGFGAFLDSDSTPAVISPETLVKDDQTRTE